MGHTDLGRGPGATPQTPGLYNPQEVQNALHCTNLKSVAKSPVLTPGHALSQAGVSGQDVPLSVVVVRGSGQYPVPYV